jgi:hypothetical protein
VPTGRPHIRRSGCFRVLIQVGRSQEKPSKTPAKRHIDSPAYPSLSHRIRYATPLRYIYSSLAPTSGPFSCCSEWRHTAHEQPAEARITYRFHPRFGEVVQIRRAAARSLCQPPAREGGPRPPRVAGDRAGRSRPAPSSGPAGASYRVARSRRAFVKRATTDVPARAANPARESDPENRGPRTAAAPRTAEGGTTPGTGTEPPPDRAATRPQRRCQTEPPTEPPVTPPPPDAQGRRPRTRPGPARPRRARNSFSGRRSVTLSALGARGRTPREGGPRPPRRRGPRPAQGAGRRRTRSRRRATGSPAAAGPS